jgi:hypothetical protein
VTHRQACGAAPLPHRHIAAAVAAICGLLAWLPLLGPIGLMFSVRSRPTVVDRFGWRFLWGLGVALNVLGTVWTILYVLVRYFVLRHAQTTKIIGGSRIRPRLGLVRAHARDLVARKPKTACSLPRERPTANTAACTAGDDTREPVTAQHFWALCPRQGTQNMGNVVAVLACWRRPA